MFPLIVCDSHYPRREARAQALLCAQVTADPADQTQCGGWDSNPHVLSDNGF